MLIHNDFKYSRPDGDIYQHLPPKYAIPWVNGAYGDWKHRKTIPDAPCWTILTSLDHVWGQRWGIFFARSGYGNIGTSRRIWRDESRSSLGGGIPTPLKNMKVNWDDYSLKNISQLMSIGMMKFPIYGKINNVPVTTNQIKIAEFWGWVDAFHSVFGRPIMDLTLGFDRENGH